MIIPTWCMNLTFVDISGWLISDMQCVKRCQTWCIVSYLLIYVLMHHICLSLIKASLFNNFSGAADIYTSSKWICCGKPGRVGTCLRFDMSAAHLCLLRLFVCVFFLLSFILLWQQLTVLTCWGEQKWNSRCIRSRKKLQSEIIKLHMIISIIMIIVIQINR